MNHSFRRILPSFKQPVCLATSAGFLSVLNMCLWWSSPPHDSWGKHFTCDLFTYLALSEYENNSIASSSFYHHQCQQCQSHYPTFHWLSFLWQCTFYSSSPSLFDRLLEEQPVTIWGYAEWNKGSCSFQTKVSSLIVSVAMSGGSLDSPFCLLLIQKGWFGTCPLNPTS